MRLLFSSCFVLISLALRADVFIGSETEVTFFSRSTIEDIAASNKNVRPVLNTATGDLIVKIPNTGFVFRSSLMQEHFNESYMESQKFPFSTFEGRINESIDSLGEGTFPVTATGKLTIHGVTRTVTIKGTLTKQDNQVQLQAAFSVLMTDYDIQVPGIKVNTKSDSDEVAITVNATLVPFKK